MTPPEIDPPQLERECLLPRGLPIGGLQAFPVLLGRLNMPSERLDGPREVHRAREVPLGLVALLILGSIIIIVVGC